MFFSLKTFNNIKLIMINVLFSLSLKNPGHCPNVRALFDFSLPRCPYCPFIQYLNVNCPKSTAQMRLKQLQSGSPPHINYMNGTFSHINFSLVLPPHIENGLPFFATFRLEGGPYCEALIPSFYPLFEFGHNFDMMNEIFICNTFSLGLGIRGVSSYSPKFWYQLNNEYTSDIKK